MEFAPAYLSISPKNRRPCQWRTYLCQKKVSAFDSLSPRSPEKKRNPGISYNQGTAEHAPSPLFCSVLACSGAPAEQTRFVLLCHPVTPRRSRRAGRRRGRGRARKWGPLTGRPPSPGPQGPTEAFFLGGDQAKIRGLPNKICSAGGRSLAICAPSAQSARRWHRHTSVCLRKHALRTLYVPRRGSALCSTPAASSGFPADEHDQPADAAFCTCNAC